VGMGGLGGGCGGKEWGGDLNTHTHVSK
jgi:hypothetical protein